MKFYYSKILQNLRIEVKQFVKRNNYSMKLSIAQFSAMLPNPQSINTDGINETQTRITRIESQKSEKLKEIEEMRTDLNTENLTNKFIIQLVLQLVWL